MPAFNPIVYRFSVATFFFFCGCTFASWASRIPTVKTLYNLNEAELGSVLFLLPMGSLAVLPVSGWAIARFGSRIMTLLTSLFYALALLMIAFVPGIAALSAALFMFGFFGNGMNICMNTQALLVQENIYRRPLMSSFHAMWSAGAMTGAIIGGWMMKRGADLAEHFAVLAGAMVLIYMCMFFLLVRTNDKYEQKNLFSFPGRALLLLGVICLCCTLCEGAMADWSSLYYMQVVNDGNKVNTLGYTSFALMMATGRLAGDKLVQKLGNKKVLLIDSVFIAAGLSIGIGILHPIAVIVGFGLIGLGVSTIIPIVYMLAGKNSNTAPGVALAAVSSIGFTGFLIGPPVIGFIAHAIGLRLALLLLIILGVGIGILSRRVKE